VLVELEPRPGRRRSDHCVLTRGVIVAPLEARGLLSNAEAAFVNECRVAHLATSGADASPHVIPICFVYLEGSFYSAIDEKPKSGTQLRRLRNIRANPRASLIFDSYDEDWTKLAWVLVRGAASILDDGPEHDAAVAALREKYSQYKTMELAGKPVVRVSPQKVSTWGKAFRDDR
jgi:PPOX class probable F420-dependent enzyme